MSEQSPHDAVRAVQRAAIEALSQTALGGHGTVTERIAAFAQSDRPSERDQALTVHGSSLTKAYAELLGIPYDTALDDLIKAARNMARWRRDAEDAWTQTCTRTGGSSIGTLTACLAAENPTIRGYADAADIRYVEACHNLHLLHGVICPAHATPGPEEKS